MPFTTDKNAECLGRGGADTEPREQHQCYLVLDDNGDEKNQRPVRNQYRHIGTIIAGDLRDLTQEEKERYGAFGYVKFETYPVERRPLLGRYLTEEEVFNKNACNRITTIHEKIARTYAKDPNFYSATYCVHCKKHRPLNEFIWIEKDGQDGPQVGT